MENQVKANGLATLTPAKVAVLFNLNKATIYKMVREGQIPHIKVGERIIFHQETLETWLRESSKMGVRA